MVLNGLPKILKHELLTAITLDYFNTLISMLTHVYELVNTIRSFVSQKMRENKPKTDKQKYDRETTSKFKHVDRTNK